MNSIEYSDNDIFGSYNALLVAFKTMKDRCQQLQARLTIVEEENACLRLECGKDMSTAIIKLNDDNEKTPLQILQEKVEDLTKEKSQLTNRVSMVDSENHQLWKRLTKLSRTNKSLGKHLKKISDTLKRHSPAQPLDIASYSFPNMSDPGKQDAIKKCQKDESLEEISLKLINSIMIEQSDLEPQYAEMVELQKNTEFDLQNRGFAYREDFDTDSLEQLKQHDSRLSQTRDALRVQQARLKKVLRNVKKMKQGVVCKKCLINENKQVCQTGTQLGCDADNITLNNPHLQNCADYVYGNSGPVCHICPLCGLNNGSDVPFKEFHEHVLNHFSEGSVTEGGDQNG